MTTASLVPEDFDAMTTGDPTAPPVSSNVASIGTEVLDEQRKREQARQQLDNFREAVRAANDTTLTTSERLERLLALNAQIIPTLMEEVLSAAPNEARSVAASRAIMAVRDMANLVVKKHETETADAFNPRSPRLQVVFGWFIELLHDIVRKHTGDDVLVSSVFNDLAAELGGWEDKVERRLKGVSQKALGTLSSPFTEDFKTRLRQGATDNAPRDPTDE